MSERKPLEWYLAECGPMYRQMSDDQFFSVTLRDREGLTDCNAQLLLSGRLLELVDELEREIIKRIKDHLP